MAKLPIKAIAGVLGGMMAKDAIEGNPFKKGMSFKRGGKVKHTGKAKVHKGERVLTKAQAKKYRKEA